MLKYLALIGILLCCSTCGADTTAATDDTQLRVVILAVNDFDETSTYRDHDLDADLLSAGQDLANFFRQNYKISPEFLYKRAETSSTALRAWLPNYFNTTQRAITLFFILTHGEGSFTPAETAYNSELYLATSDASKGTITSVGLKARAELLSYFRMLPNGSSVFLFIDTCDAASIGSEGLKRELNNDQDHKMMILAASKANKKSYQARFTRTLQRLWEVKSPPCTHGETDIESLVTSSMDKFYPLNVPTDQTQEVKMVKAYTQDFCLESFGPDQSLLLVGNPSPIDEMEVSWREEGDLQDSPKSPPIGAHSIAAFRLLRKLYRLHAEIGNADAFTLPVDLQNGHSIQLVIAKPNPRVGEISGLGQNALDIVASSGMPAKDIDTFTDTLRSDLSTYVDVSTTEVDHRNHAAAIWAQKLQDLAASQTSTVVELDTALKNVDKAKAELSTCCHHSVLGVDIVDIRAMASKKTELQSATDAVSVINDEMQHIETLRAEAEVGAAQAYISVLQAQQQLNEAQSALTNFVDAVQARTQSDQELKKGQQELAHRLSNPLWQASRTDRGIIITVKDTGPDHKAELKTALETLGEQIRGAIPGALIEVEAYSENGNSKKAKLLAESIANILKRPPDGSVIADGGGLVARGFGRVLTVEDGKTVQIPTQLRIVISSTSLGYLARSSRDATKPNNE
jgi:hypothetical protein